jgi:NAD(P)-dependent dehydrogenase (short-subunit alcohol dehydrogenase family)
MTATRLSGRVAIVTGAARGIVVSAYPVDVTDEPGVADALRAVLAAEGRIDILVNNAGIYPHTPFEKLTFAEWRRVLSINLDGVFLVTRAVYPHMRERRLHHRPDDQRRRRPPDALRMSHNRRGGQHR